MNPFPKNIAELNIHEKIQLVQDLWDSIDKERMPPISDAAKAELNLRAAWADANPNSGKKLEQIAASSVCVFEIQRWPGA